MQAKPAESTGRVRKFFCVVATALALTACGDDAPEGKLLAGSVQIHNAITDTRQAFPVFVDWEGGTCEGRGRRESVQPGAQVTITDGDGKTIGTTTLGEGEYVPATEQCSLAFAVTDVRSDDYVTITIAGQDPVTKSIDDLDDQGWNVQIQL